MAGRALDGDRLHEFSVTEAPAFWRAWLEWSGLPWSGSADTVLVGEDVETARFFPDVQLNYAEALLRPLPHVDDDAPALTSVRAGGTQRTWSRRELRADVTATAAALHGVGVRTGDQVVAVVSNHGGAAVAVLACAALGAPVATATPDTAVEALAERFAQTDPVVLLADRAGLAGDADAAVAALVAALPTLRRVVLLDEAPVPGGGRLPADRLADLLARHPAGAPGWPRLPFDHPLFVMSSSGTTGPPKAMVHGAGGTLLEHVKEHVLHGDLRPADVLWFHTTTAWMMWNWQLSALAVGAHVVLYDGPFGGPGTLWELVSRLGVTVFGTSPAHLQTCQDAGVRPGERFDLSRLRAVLSTGSVLHDWQDRWVQEAVAPVPVQSISGGTDIIGCFLLGDPELPVRPGRCQTRSLGLDVAVFDDSGRAVTGEVGELVCRRPFPSRPVRFLRDPDGRRFHAAYFAAFPGVWTHGDRVDLDPDGSARVHGRSDGVLNVHGIRVGPSEVHSALRAVPGIAETLAVEQRVPDRPGGTRMVLLVVLRPGAVLDGGLDRTIRRTLRRTRSAAHVPSRVVAVPELPTTYNGKRSETAARDAVNGDPVPNERSLRNPGSLAGITAAVRAAGGRRGPAVADDAAEDVPAGVTRAWCGVRGVRSPGPPTTPGTRVGRRDG